MKSRVLISIVSAGLLMSIAHAGDAREQAILKKIKGQYKAMDKAMATINPENIVPFFTDDAVMVPKKGKPSPMKEAAIEMCSRFKKRKSATVRSYVKQFKMIDSKTMECMAKVKMDLVLPLRGLSTGESKVRFESMTKDVWKYTSKGWKLGKSYAIADKMYVDGKPYDPSKGAKKAPAGKPASSDAAGPGDN